MVLFIRSRISFIQSSGSGTMEKLSSNFRLHIMVNLSSTGINISSISLTLVKSSTRMSCVTDYGRVSTSTFWKSSSWMWIMSRDFSKHSRDVRSNVKLHRFISFVILFSSSYGKSSSISMYWPANALVANFASFRFLRASLAVVSISVISYYESNIIWRSSRIKSTVSSFSKRSKVDISSWFG